MRPAILLCLGAIALGTLLPTACHAPQRPGVEDLAGHENLVLFKLHSLRGTRDGDHLEAQAMFSDSSSILMLDMQFAIGSPTRLQSGTWRWMRGNRPLSGTVAARSVMFFGGQTVLPSLGGTFDLVDAAGTPRYRVTIPAQQLAALPNPQKNWLEAHPSTTAKP
ncbi:MAG TPA: hypothetical protein VKV15_24330 [Bryobacteraceae bacterium]|nr:hypothetical protein [Bryobacteraceae bacterium]